MKTADIDADEIRRRLACFESTTDFNDLWPEVKEPLRNAFHRKIFAVTKSVLNALPENRHLAANNDEELRALGVAAYASGMGPLLGYWIETGSITADPIVTALLTRHLHHGRRRAEEIFGHCVGLVGALGERDVIPTLMKGMYTSRRFFPEPGVRPMADVDLLIPLSRRSAAEEALESVGFRKTAASPGQSSWSPRDRTQRIHSLEFDHASNPWNIDLHTSIDRGFTGGFAARFGQVPFDTVCPWELGEHPVLVFAQPLLLVHLAVHTAANVHQVQLVRLVELALVMREGIRDATLQWDHVLKLSNELDVTRFVHPILELTERLVPGTLPRGFRARGLSVATRRVTRVINHRIDTGMSVGARRSLDELLVWARGPLELLIAVANVARAEGTAGLLGSYRRRLRLLLRGRVAWRARS